MFKRKYFVKMTSTSNEGGTDHRFRLFTRTSWFAQDDEALKFELKAFAEHYKVDVKNVTVDSFNRL
jgi:hypothetical protein